MSDMDQAFIKAYQEARTTPPAKRPVAFTAAAPSRPANSAQRLDAPHAAHTAVPPASVEPLAHPRVPTPHLHLAARGAAWLEPPQPQLVAAAVQEFAAEEDDECAATPGGDLWIVSMSASPAGGAPRAMSPGFGGPIRPAPSSASPASPDASAMFSNSIKPSGPPLAGVAPPLPVRPAGGGPWSPASLVGGPTSASLAAQRVAAVEMHTEEIAQHLASVGHTLAMLEGNTPTEICLEKHEVTLVVRDGDSPPEKSPEVAAAPVSSEAVPNGESSDQPASAIAVAASPALSTAAVAEAPAAEETLERGPGAAPEKFQPQWEVDRFQWPDLLDRLRDRAAGEISAACAAIQATCAAGQKVLAITGVEEAMGSTTLLLSLGRELAQRGVNVAIVDADFDRPTLAERTGLRIQHGWEATLTGSLPLEEVAVASLQDRLTLVPLVARQGVSSTMASLHAARHLRRLRDHFDVVLIDAGVGSENVAALVTATADDALDIAVVLTIDQRRSEPAATDEVVGRLRHCGINSIQLGETFVSA